MYLVKLISVVSVCNVFLSALYADIMDLLRLEGWTYLSQSDFVYHDYSWNFTKSHHVFLNIFDDFWWLNMVIIGDIQETLHDISRYLVKFEDIQVFFVIKAGFLSWNIMT